MFLRFKARTLKILGQNSCICNKCSAKLPIKTKLCNVDTTVILKRSQLPEKIAQIKKTWIGTFTKFCPKTEKLKLCSDSSFSWMKLFILYVMNSKSRTAMWLRKKSLLDVAPQFTFHVIITLSVEIKLRDNSNRIAVMLIPNIEIGK